MGNNMPALRTLTTSLSTLPKLHLRALATSTTAMSTISSAITKDHRELEQYYNEIVNSTNHDHQQRYGNQFTWELAVYPAFEKYLGSKGKDMAESDRKEHHQVKELLKVFQDLSSTDPQYLSKLKEIWEPLSRHMKEEEEHDMPALEEALRAQRDASSKMATSFGRTKMFVPSRSHPSAGEHPPFETVMGLLTAPFDHVADIFRKFPDQTISPNPSTK